MNIDKDEVLYRRPSGREIRFSHIQDNEMYAYIQDVNGTAYPTKSLVSLLSKGYWDAVWTTSKLQKHYPGGQDHNQDRHGSWSPGQGDSLSEVKNYISGLPENKINVLESYISNPMINQVIRGYESDYYAQERFDPERAKAKEIDMLFAQAPKLKEDLVVYRAISQTLADDLKAQIANQKSEDDEIIIADKGFTSTTTTPQLASNPIYTFGEQHEVIAIKVPKGTSVLWLEGVRQRLFPQNMAENEILLMRRNSLFYSEDDSDQQGILTFEYARE